MFYGYLAIDSGKYVLHLMNQPQEQAVASSIELQQQADEGVLVHKSAKGQESPLWINLMAYTNSSQYTYGSGSVWDIAIYYAQMSNTHKVILSTHMILAGFSMFIGSFQFIPSLRKKYLKLHRNMGKAYVLSTQTAMIFAAVYLVITPVEHIYSTLVFYVGLCVLAVTVTLSLWISMYHLYRREIAQHQVWMALNFGLMLTAPFLRYDWMLLGTIFPSLSQAETNLSVMVFLIPQSILVGYIIFCLSRSKQKYRLVQQQLPFLTTVRKLLPYWGMGVSAFMLITIGIIVHHFLIYPSMFYSEIAQVMVPKGVLLVEYQALMSSMSLRWGFAISASVGLIVAIPFMFTAFKHEVISDQNQIKILRYSLLIAIATLINGFIQAYWGYFIGAPNYTAISGGTFYMMNGLISLSFGALLIRSVVLKDIALSLEWSVFAILSLLATPFFYLSIRFFSWMSIPQHYIDGGHAYMLAAISGSTLLSIGIIYAAYGLATRRKIPI